MLVFFDRLPVKKNFIIPRFQVQLHATVYLIKVLFTTPEGKHKYNGNYNDIKLKELTGGLTGGSDDEPSCPKSQTATTR